MKTPEKTEEDPDDLKAPDQGDIQMELLVVQPNTISLLFYFLQCTVIMVGHDSAVGIATRYGLDGPGIESRWGRDFPRSSRPALGPTQPPVQWVPGLSRG